MLFLVFLPSVTKSASDDFSHKLTKGNNNLEVLKYYSNLGSCVISTRTISIELEKIQLLKCWAVGYSIFLKLIKFHYPIMTISQ